MITPYILPNAIIAGTGRAGSTSLFRYLTDHPEVCGSSTKETQFFIRHMEGIVDADLREYATYFSACRDRHTIRIEATPHYLQFADQIAPLIHDTLPDVRLIFILREPAGRLFTGYRNLRELESHTYGSWTFDDFVEQAVRYHDSADHHAKDASLRAANYMDTGCYANYLSTYYRIFDDNRICILFFDTLTTSPREFVSRAARFLHIDEKFYDSYIFSRENRTRTFRSSAVHRLAFSMNQLLEPVLNRTPAVRRIIRNAYNLLNEDKSATESPSPESMSSLLDFYGPHNSRLRSLLQEHGYADNLPAWLSPGSDGNLHGK